MRMRCTKAGHCWFVAGVEVLSFSWFLPPEGLSVLNPRLRREPRVPVVLGMTRYLRCFGSKFFFKSSNLLRTHSQWLKTDTDVTKCSNSLIICMLEYLILSKGINIYIFCFVFDRFWIFHYDIFRTLHFPCVYSTCWLISECISQSRYDIYHGSSTPLMWLTPIPYPLMRKAQTLRPLAKD